MVSGKSQWKYRYALTSSAERKSMSTTPEVLEMAADESIVVFSSKELFMQVNSKLDLILVETGKKADKADLERLREQVTELQMNGSGHAQNALKQVAALDARMDGLALNAASTQAVSETREQINRHDARIKLALIGMIITLAGLVAQFVLSLLHIKG